MTIESLPKTFCILPWIHLCTTMQGSHRPCCSWDSNKEPYIPVETKIDGNILNSDFYKGMRRKMLDGVAIAACSQCYIKDNAGSVSMRMSALRGYEDDIKFCTDDNFYKLKFIELVLDNTCNLQCRMCTSEFSSALSRVESAINYRQDSPKYNNAMLDINSLSDDDFQNIREIKLIGGEPLYSKKHRYVLETLINKGVSKNIILNYSTNGSIYHAYLEEMWPKFKRVNISISLDGVGKINEYQRVLSDFAEIENNVGKMSDIHNVAIQYHTAVTLLNIAGLPNLYKYVSERISDPIHWHYGVDISGPTGVGALPNELKAWVLGYLKNNVPENLTLLLEKSMNSKLDDINLEFKLKHIAKLDKYHKMYMKDYVPELYNFLDSNYAFGQYYN